MARQQLARLFAKCVGYAATPACTQTLSIAPYALGALKGPWHTGGQTRSCSGKGSSSSSNGSDSIQSSSSSPTAADPLDDQFSRMMEVMMENPTVMEMMMARMPPHMRNPEVLKALMSNPDVRSRMTALAQEKGLSSIIQNVDLDQVRQGMSATLQAGIDPAAIVQHFQQSPTLAKAMENPRVMAALMDMASNGADALKKYQGDKDIVEAAMEAGQILQQLQETGGAQASSSEGSLSTSSDSSPQASSSMSDVEQQLGVSPEQLMQRLLTRPDLLAKVQDPEIQAALVEVSQSPWKIMKYLFNKKVMSALKDMKELVDAGKKS